MARWAEALGFQPGMSPSSVKAQALQALGAQAQSAALARSNLPRLADSLRRLYLIVRHEADDAAESATADGGTAVSRGGPTAPAAPRR